MSKPKPNHPLGRSIKKQIHQAVAEMPDDIRKGLEGYEKVREQAQEALKRRPPLPKRRSEWDNVTLVARA